MLWLLLFYGLRSEINSDDYDFEHTTELNMSRIANCQLVQFCCSDVNCPLCRSASDQTAPIMSEITGNVVSIDRCHTGLFGHNDVPTEQFENQTQASTGHCTVPGHIGCSFCSYDNIGKPTGRSILPTAIMQQVMQSPLFARLLHSEMKCWKNGN